MFSDVSCRMTSSGNCVVCESGSVVSLIFQIRLENGGIATIQAIIWRTGVLVEAGIEFAAVPVAHCTSP